MPKCIDKLRQFDWKKNKKWVIIAVILLIIILILIITLAVVLSRSRSKCSTREGSMLFKDYQKKALEEHNKYRRKHQVGPLQLVPRLNLIAENCAKYYVTRVGTIDHSCPCKESYGENLYMGGSGKGDINSAELAVKAWYSEVSQYDYGNPVFSGKTGHFTAIVWKACQGLGFGSYKNVIVALYSPHPNVEGHFKENVLPEGTPDLRTGNDDSS